MVLIDQTLVGDDETIFSLDAAERICAGLGAPPTRHAYLETTAILYRSFLKRERAGTQKGLRADMRAVRRSVIGALRAVDAIQIPHLAALAVALLQTEPTARPIPRLAALKQELIWLISAIDDLLNALPAATIQRTPASVLAAVTCLSYYFTRWTGQRITHSSHKDGEYVGGALSPFGLFVTAFFAVVDPALSAKTIATAVKLTAKEQRAHPIPPDPS